MILSNPIELFYDDFLSRKYDCVQTKLEGKSFNFYLGQLKRRTALWEREPLFNDHYNYTTNTFTAHFLQRAPIILLTRSEIRTVLNTIDTMGIQEVDADDVLLERHGTSDPLTSSAEQLVRHLSFYDCVFHDYAIGKLKRRTVFRKCAKFRKAFFIVTFS